MKFVTRMYTLTTTSTSRIRQDPKATVRFSRVKSHST